MWGGGLQGQPQLGSCGCVPPSCGTILATVSPRAPCQHFRRDLATVRRVGELGHSVAAGPSPSRYALGACASPLPSPVKCRGAAGSPISHQLEAARGQDHVSWLHPQCCCWEGGHRGLSGGWVCVLETGGLAETKYRLLAASTLCG